MSKTSKIFSKCVSFVVAMAMFFFIPSIFCACIGNNRYDGELLRLHIRANSNSAVDQSVKLAVRDAVNEYIENNVHKSSFDEAYREIGARLNVLDGIATNVLTRHGFHYGAKSFLRNEYFPTRVYEDVTVPEGYYDALIIELGEAKGDNWWCVIYPPLCYGDNGGEKFEYKSFFAELFS